MESKNDMYRSWESDSEDSQDLGNTLINHKSDEQLNESMPVPIVNQRDKSPCCSESHTVCLDCKKEYNIDYKTGELTGERKNEK